MYKLIRECGMPKWLKVLINILLTLTCIYWIGWFLYKILNVVRLFLHTMTEEKIWWISLGIMLVCAITTLLILQFGTDLKPFTNMWDWLTGIFVKG